MLRRLLSILLGLILVLALCVFALIRWMLHDPHQLAFAHPSNLKGVEIARDAGVDVLAHAADDAEGVTTEVLQSLIDRHMSMVPTLKMFRTTVTHNPAYLDPIYAEVKQFHALGGDLLFGTDVGYMTDYTTEDEFTGLANSGLNAMDILRMLTTAPAARFHVEADKGSIVPANSPTSRSYLGTSQEKEIYVREGIWSRQEGIGLDKGPGSRWQLQLVRAGRPFAFLRCRRRQLVCRI